MSEIEYELSKRRAQIQELKQFLIGLSSNADKLNTLVVCSIDENNEIKYWTHGSMIMQLGLMKAFQMEMESKLKKDWNLL